MITILIISEDARVLEIPESLCSQEGVSVDSHQSARTIRGRIQSCSYDIVISDIDMAGIDGLALLSEIRESGPDALIIVIANQRALTVRALPGGVYDFISKPVDPDCFIACLKRAI